MGDKDFDFGELSKDENFKKKMVEFRDAVENSSNMLEAFFKKFNYEELSSEDKVRVRGVDPNQHEIKGQIHRVRQYMNMSKQIYEKKKLMPRVDQGAAKRFIRNGLWVPHNSEASKSNSDESQTEVPLKRIKMD